MLNQRNINTDITIRSVTLIGFVGETEKEEGREEEIPKPATPTGMIKEREERGRREKKPKW